MLILFDSDERIYINAAISELAIWPKALKPMNILWLYFKGKLSLGGLKWLS